MNFVVKLHVLKKFDNQTVRGLTRKCLTPAEFVYILFEVRDYFKQYIGTGADTLLLGKASFKLSPKKNIIINVTILCMKARIYI